jgi:multiple sugar transport system permease protein
MNRKSKTAKNLKRIIFLYLPLSVFLIWFLFPLYWMFVTSIKPDLELAKLSYPLFVNQPTFQHYHDLLFKSDFRYWFGNSLIVSVVSTVLSVCVSCLGAYAIARLKFKGRWIISRGVLFSYLIPRTILFLPLFSIVQMLHVADTLRGLILVYLTFMIPFCTWLLIGYFRTIPLELEECALIDGAGRFKILKDIIIPIALPGIATATIFSFTLSWNEFLYPLVFNTTSAMQVVPVGISFLITGDLIEWGEIMAAGLLFTLPMIFVYYPIQGYIEEGMTAGAVKG